MHHPGLALATRHWSWFGCFDIRNMGMPTIKEQQICEFPEVSAMPVKAELTPLPFLFM